MVLRKSTYFLFNARAPSRRPLRAALSEASFSMPVAEASPSTRARGKRIVLSFIFCLNRCWMDRCEESAEKLFFF